MVTDIFFTARGKSAAGRFYGFKLRPVINDRGGNTLLAQYFVEFTSNKVYSPMLRNAKLPIPFLRL
jgi:hypothetical protein